VLRREPLSLDAPASVSAGGRKNSHKLRRRLNAAETSALKMALMVVEAVLLRFIVAGIVIADLRFFLWIGIVGLITYAIAGLVMARSST